MGVVSCGWFDKTPIARPADAWLSKTAFVCSEKPRGRRSAARGLWHAACSTSTRGIERVAHPREFLLATSTAAFGSSTAGRRSSASGYALAIAAIAAVTLLRLPLDRAFLHG